MTIAVEAINGARNALMALYDEHLPDWEDEARRLSFIDAVADVFENLDRALSSATTAKALGCVLPRPSEDGVAPATRHG